MVREKKPVHRVQMTEGGKGQMCKMLEEMREEAATKAAAKATIEAEHRKAIEMAGKLLADKIPLEKVAEYTGLAIEEI